MLDVWRNVLDEIEQSISSSQFSTWFAGVELLSIDEGKIVIGVPNIFKRSQIQSRYSEVIKAAFEHNDIKVREISYDMINGKKSLKDRNNHTSQPQTIKVNIERNSTIKPLSTGLNPRYTLENFIIGSNNDLAVSVANNIVEHPGEKYNPFFLYGNVGVGKTHLIQANGIRIKERNPNAKVLFVPMKHFQTLFQDAKFYSMLRNTLVISGLNLLTFPAPIILALIMNEVRNAKFKKVIQTSVYLPHFLSWTIIASLTFFLLSSEQGVINKIAVALGGEPQAYLFSPTAIYPIIVIQSLWRGIGWGSIVYLAAIAGVDQSLYEAAKMDGATKLQCMIKITIPSIMPTIIVMLILKMGSIVSVDFEQVFLMNNAMVKKQLEVFEIYIYNNGIAGGSTQYSYTTAIGMFKSVINTSLVILTNWITSRKGYEGIM